MTTYQGSIKFTILIKLLQFCICKFSNHRIKQHILLTTYIPWLHFQMMTSFNALLMSRRCQLTLFQTFTENTLF